MRSPAVYAGFLLLGAGFLVYAALFFEFSGFDALVTTLAGAGCILAAVGWLHAETGRGHGLVVAGLVPFAFFAVMALGQLMVASSPRALIADLLGTVGAAAIGGAAIRWAASPAHEAAAIVWLRVGAGLTGLAAVPWIVGNIVPPQVWLLGNLPILVGGGLVAWKLDRPGRDDAGKGGRERAISSAAERFLGASRR